MNKEKNSKWYDNHYCKFFSKGGKYDTEYKDSVYFDLWSKIIDLVNDNESIADFGCGVGQFASFATSENKKYVLGVDFSSVAVKEAKLNNQNIQNVFVCSNLFDSSIYTSCEYDVAVFCEVLEHIEKDKEILSLVPAGKKVIVSLPLYDALSHVRFFLDEKDVIKRYQDSMKILFAYTIKLTKRATCVVLYAEK